jgi:hypothetical protein
MNHKTGPHHLGTSNACSQTRLAESAVAAIDLCSCGTLQLHIGPLTLRLAPCALSELRATVDKAMAAFGARDVAPAARTAPVSFFGGKRGDA